MVYMCAVHMCSSSVLFFRLMVASCLHFKEMIEAGRQVGAFAMEPRMLLFGLDGLEVYNEECARWSQVHTASTA